MKYVFDTSAVILLLEICDLEKQLRAFSTKNSLYITKKVKEEFLDGCKINKNVVNVFSLCNSVLDENILQYFNQDSSSGEFWTISYSCNNNCVCVIDEGFGRNLCNFLGIQFTGSVGIIDEMRKQGFLSKEDLFGIRKRIRNSHFYLSKELLKKLDSICKSSQIT